MIKKSKSNTFSDTKWKSFCCSGLVFYFSICYKKLLFTRPAGITSLTPSAGTTGNNSVDEQRISVF